MTACFHRDHSRLMATQKNLSNRLRAGRGRRRFSTVNCCRSTKFSKMRSWRLQKIRRSDPSASHSTLSIIGVITEFWQGRRLCYWFQSRPEFWRGTGYWKHDCYLLRACDQILNISTHREFAVSLSTATVPPTRSFNIMVIELPASQGSLGKLPPSRRRPSRS